MQLAKFKTCVLVQWFIVRDWITNNLDQMFGVQITPSYINVVIMSRAASCNSLMCSVILKIVLMGSNSQHHPYKRLALNRESSLQALNFFVPF